MAPILAWPIVAGRRVALATGGSDAGLLARKATD